MELVTSNSLLDALRIVEQLSYSQLAAKLSLSYQTVRRMCTTPGTPRIETLNKLAKVYPGLTDALWRRFSYLCEVPELENFEVEAKAIINAALHCQELPGSIKLAAGRRAKAVSFYLHEEHISALTLLSNVLGKSQSQIIRDHINDLTREYLLDMTGMDKLQDDVSDYEFTEPSDAILSIEDSEHFDALLGSLIRDK
jgi:transcriptional regulator with XRE-family HTH domain/predicted DNA-binding protein